MMWHVIIEFKVKYSASNFLSIHSDRLRSIFLTETCNHRSLSKSNYCLKNITNELLKLDNIEMFEIMTSQVTTCLALMKISFFNYVKLHFKTKLKDLID